jgi:hypothetical protein
MMALRGGKFRWVKFSDMTCLQLTQRYFRGGRYVETDVDIASSVVASQVCTARIARR